jgi:hypothetical protein
MAPHTATCNCKREQWLDPPPGAQYQITVASRLGFQVPLSEEEKVRGYYYYTPLGMQHV